MTFLMLIAGSMIGCGKNSKAEEKIRTKPVKAYIAEEKNFTVKENGISVSPGSDVTFEVTLAEGYKLVGNDYAGESRVWQDKNHTLITLLSVKYPVGVHLQLANTFFSVTYNSNDEEDIEFTVYEEKKYHLRPNTINEEEAFKKDGYVLAAWNTAADGSGERIGLGSRVTCGDEGVTLYAMWEKCSDPSLFSYSENEDGSLNITGLLKGKDAPLKLVIPEKYDGKVISGISSFAFPNAHIEQLICSSNIKNIEDNAFFAADLKSVTICDNIENVSDKAFECCENLKTLYINASKKPAGAATKKESCYADKIDVLMLAKGKRKLVFYGGCSMWYNLDMDQIFTAFGDMYYPVDIALNGTVNGQVQMEIFEKYLEKGDVLFHTPELASEFQMLEKIDMGRNDVKLWSGIEYNYDLFSLVDISGVNGVFDSLCWYLSKKNDETEYEDIYTDSAGRVYFGPNGEVPFKRFDREVKELRDKVGVTRQVMSDTAKERMALWYETFAKKGVSVYVSYACINMDAISRAEGEILNDADKAFGEFVNGTGNARLISYIKDYLYYDPDFFDTNYHLLTPQVVNNTKKWVRDLKEVLKNEDNSD